MPNRMLVNSETTVVKTITRPSMGMRATVSQRSGSSRRRPRRARKATPMPTAPPMSANSRFSIQNCFWICQREAPSASRVATSEARRSMRTSVNPARLAQAMRRMKPAATINASTLGRSEAVSPFWSGTE